MSVDHRFINWNGQHYSESSQPFTIDWRLSIASYSFGCQKLNRVELHTATYLVFNHVVEFEFGEISYNSPFLNDIIC